MLESESLESNASSRMLPEPVEEKKDVPAPSAPKAEEKHHDEPKPESNPEKKSDECPTVTGQPNMRNYLGLALLGTTIPYSDP